MLPTHDSAHRGRPLVLSSVAPGPEPPKGLGQALLAADGTLQMEYRACNTQLWLLIWGRRLGKVTKLKDLLAAKAHLCSLCAASALLRS